MKSTDFVIIFVIILLGCTFILDIFVDNQVEATCNINESNEKLWRAATDCVYGVKHKDSTKNIVGTKEGISKAELLDKFFMSLYANYGVIGSKSKQALLQMYTPIFAVIDINGFDISYLTEINKSGVLHLTRKWSGDFSYSYMDTEANLIYTFTLGDNMSVYDLVSKESTSDYYANVIAKMDRGKLTEFKDATTIDEEGFYKFRDSVIIDSITNKLTYFINEHNSITSQRGISYNFNLPSLSKTDIDSILNGSGVLVLFQGNTYAGNTADAYFNSSLVSIKFQKNMSIKIVRDISNGIRIYHKRNCALLDDHDVILECDSKITAAKNGAYPCIKCNP